MLSPDSNPEATCVDAAAWYVYLLRRITTDPDVLAEKADPISSADTKAGSRDLYVGMTNNLAARLHHHNTDQVRATRGMRWALIAYAVYQSRGQAALVEKWLKTGDSRLKRRNFHLLLNLHAKDRAGQSNYFVRKAYLWRDNRDLKRNFTQMTQEAK